MVYDLHYATQATQAELTRARDPLSSGHLVIDGEALRFRIDERRRQVDHARQRRGQYVYMPRWDCQPTGQLRLHISAPDPPRAVRTWKDSTKTRLEQQVSAILLGMLDEAQRIKGARERARLVEIERHS